MDDTIITLTSNVGWSAEVFDYFGTKGIYTCEKKHHLVCLTHNTFVIAFLVI